MAKGAKPKKPETAKPARKPKDTPTRDTRDSPAPNPNGDSDIPDTSTREEVEKIRPKSETMKRWGSRKALDHVSPSGEVPSERFSASVVEGV